MVVPYIVSFEKREVQNGTDLVRGDIVAADAGDKQTRQFAVFVKFVVCQSHFGRSTQSTRRELVASTSYVVVFELDTIFDI